MLWNIIFACLMATGVLTATSKRDDYSSSSSSGSSSVSFPSSSYSSSGSAASGYASGSSSYGSGSPTYTGGSSSYSAGSSGYGTGSSTYSSGSKPYVSGGSASGYSGSASSSSGVSSQPASQGNLYYYYYPVQPKPQDSDSSSSQSSPSYSSSGSESYEPSSSSAFGNQVGSSAADDYNAQESSYNAAVSPLDAASYSAASLGGLPSYAGAGYASSLLGGTGYAAAGSAPPGYAAAPSVAYAPSGYGGSLSSYGQPYGGYGYGQPAADYSGGKKFGLSSLIMPMLALAGLGLLIPTVTSLGSRTKKTKRSLGDNPSFASVGERLDRYLAIYRSAVENEECVSRIICELGNTMTDVGGKSVILSVLEKVVPVWMKNKMGVFKNAVLSGDVGKCRKYKC